MKIAPLIVLSLSSASAMSIWLRQFGRGGFGNRIGGGFATPNLDQDADVVSDGGDTANEAQDGDTLVLTEIGGIPGNECLTFRNNGEIVDAACVNEAADRQVTPTNIDGQQVLRVQRSFTAGFRPDLVDIEACVGFNGTHFRAEDCSSPDIELVIFADGQLTAQRGACASGHDDAAQMTVDTSGASCATYTGTSVPPTAP